VWTAGGNALFGWPKEVGLDAETDSADLYLKEPQWVNPTTQERTPMDNISGVLVPRSSVDFIQVYEPSNV
jgi:hypothetical protein